METVYGIPVAAFITCTYLAISGMLQVQRVQSGKVIVGLLKNGLKGQLVTAEFYDVHSYALI